MAKGKTAPGNPGQVMRKRHYAGMTRGDAVSVEVPASTRCDPLFFENTPLSKRSDRPSGKGDTSTDTDEVLARVRWVSRRLVQVQEQERHAIARQLHDGVGQSLTLLMLSLNLVRREQMDKVSPHLQEAESLVKHLIRQVRALSLDLRPAMLDQFGLLSALVWYFQRCREQTGLQVKFKHYGFCRDISPEIGITAYRIVQEALRNVTRHAGVNEATASASVDDTALVIRIEDRGAGFDPTVMASQSSRGIDEMKGRAWLVGGDLKICSAPGCGTAVVVELPLSSPAEDAEAQPGPGGRANSSEFDSNAGGPLACHALASGHKR